MAGPIDSRFTEPKLHLATFIIIMNLLTVVINLIIISSTDTIFFHAIYDTYMEEDEKAKPHYLGQEEHKAN